MLTHISLHWRWFLALLLTLLGLLTFVYRGAEHVSQADHQAYLRAVHALQLEDLALNNEILGSRAQIVQNYDVVVRNIDSSRKLLSTLASPPDFLSQEGRGSIQAAVETLRQYLAYKAELVDRYQRANAALHNSQSYFPSAVEQLKGHNELGGFIRDVLRMSRKPEPEVVNRVQHTLDVLSKRSDLPPDIQHVLPHVRVIANYFPEVESIAEQIVSAPTQSQVNRVEALYGVAFDAASQLANLYRLALYGIALTLLALVSLALIRIEHEQKNLSTANQELEKRMNSQLAAEAQLGLYASAFTHAAEGMIITDQSARILAVNPAFSRITGYKPDEAINQTPALLKSGMHDEGLYASLWLGLQNQGYWAGEIWNRRKSGETYPQWLSIAAIKDGYGVTTHYIGSLTDISKLKEDERQIYHLAHHDALTGLPNRLVVEDRIQQSVAASRRSGRMAAVLFIDLDRFKHINDTLGHSVGDLLLVEASERGLSNLRETDTLSRQGGDEFVVVLPDIESAQDASVVARKLLLALSRPYFLAGHELTISASIGIALSPNDGEDVSELLRNADAAMYEAKENGRNQYRFYSPTMNTDALGQLLLEAHLRTTLDRGELFLHYQPKFDARTQRLIGAEALMRWNHPQQGVIPPEQFIPLAEECGLISALGEWAIRSVCGQLRDWIKAGLMPVPVAVNVSAQQLHTQNLPDVIEQVLKEFNVSAELLSLELTESLLMHNTPDTIKTLLRLSEMGIKMAIDDFGVGYSSLSYLHHFPVQMLKIDKSFVKDIHNLDGRSKAKLATAIIAIGHSLEMEVIAEGVENTEQRDYLTEQGCDQLQGFLFARPLPTTEFELLLSRAPAA